MLLMSDLELKYLSKAKALGIDTENPTQMYYLVKGVRYSEARFSMQKYNRVQLADKLGLSPEGLDNEAQNPYLKQAVQIVFEVMMEEMRDTDLKQQVLSIFHSDYADWLNNMSRIARGEKHPVTGKAVMDRDAVNAFTALTNTKLNEAFMAMLFVPETENSPEKAYLSVMNQLSQEEEVIDLDPKQLPAPQESLKNS